MRVVITGAAGTIGGAAADDLASDHEVVRLDRRWSRQPSMVADLSRRAGPLTPPGLRPRWPATFKGADAVLHMAAVLSPAGEGRRGWQRVLKNNICGTWNVLEAAAKHNVPRVIFGSSTWAIRALFPDGVWPASGPAIDSDLFPRPLQPYGLSKAFGEIAGRMFVDEGWLESFVTVRIGFCPPDGVPPVREDFLRDIWVGRNDMTSLLRRCVEGNIRGYHVVYGVSDMPGCGVDLGHTRTLLDWSPAEGKQDSPPS